jgi:hypothetical protein
MQHAAGRAGRRAPVERREVLVLKRLAQLNDAVRAEVEDDDRVAVYNRPHRLAGGVDDDKRLEVLVADGLLAVAGLCAQLVQAVDDVGALVRRLAEDVRLPAALDDVPVRLQSRACHDLS